MANRKLIRYLANDVQAKADPSSASLRRDLIREDVRELAAQIAQPWNRTPEPTPEPEAAPQAEPPPLTRRELARTLATGQYETSEIAQRRRREIVREDVRESLDVIYKNRGIRFE